MYLKSPKTGSTSLLTLLGTCTGGAGDKPTCFQPLEVRRRLAGVLACVPPPSQHVVGSGSRLLATQTGLIEPPPPPACAFHRPLLPADQGHAKGAV